MKASLAITNKNEAALRVLSRNKLPNVIGERSGCRTAWISRRACVDVELLRGRTVLLTVCCRSAPHPPFHIMSCTMGAESLNLCFPDSFAHGSG